MIASSRARIGSPALRCMIFANGVMRWRFARERGARALTTEERSELRITRYWITVDKPSRTVTIYRTGKLIHRYQAVIGKPGTPTPYGLAAIYEIDPQPNPTGFLGPWSLPLTIFSSVLYNFGGGPGRVAIHGRDGASLLDPMGSERSHGCIRIDNSAIDWMAMNIPQGTPVQITHWPGRRCSPTHQPAKR